MTARGSHAGGAPALAGSEALREATHGCRVVLLTATELEAEPLRDALSSVRRFEVVTKMVSISTLHERLSTTGGRRGRGRSGLRVALAVSGCDKVNAALTLASLLQAMDPTPELVLQVGIAGGLPAVGGGPGAQPGDLVIATQEAYSDTGASSPEVWMSAGELGLPIAQVDGRELGGVFPMERSLVEWAVDTLGRTAWHGSEGAGKAPAVLAGPCVTSSTVTGRQEEAWLIAERWGALAESMEGAAAAQVCALHRVPFLEVRGISNMAGDHDRSGWQIQQAAETAGRAAVALLNALAQKTGD